MAEFTEYQINSIYFYLGYPLAQSNATLAAAITRVETNPEAVETTISVITELDAASTKVQGLLSSAGIKKIDDIEFYPTLGGLSASQVDARSYGRMLVRRLASIFGVCILQDVFEAFNRTVTSSNRPARTII